jgi:hypothetical protein
LRGYDEGEEDRDEKDMDKKNMKMTVTVDSLER